MKSRTSMNSKEASQRDPVKRRAKSLRGAAVVRQMPAQTEKKA